MFVMWQNVNVKVNKFSNWCTNHTFVQLDSSFLRRAMCTFLSIQHVAGGCEDRPWSRDDTFCHSNSWQLSSTQSYYFVAGADPIWHLVCSAALARGAERGPRLGSDQPVEPHYWPLREKQSATTKQASITNYLHLFACSRNPFQHHYLWAATGWQSLPSGWYL